MINQSEILSRSQVQFITLFSGGAHFVGLDFCPYTKCKFLTYRFCTIWSAHCVPSLVQLCTKSISTGAQYVTPDGNIYCEHVKMCRFSSGYWFFCTKFVQVAVASKRRMHSKIPRFFSFGRGAGGCECFLSILGKGGRVV